VFLGMGGLLVETRASVELRETWFTYRPYFAGPPLNAKRWRRFRLRPANLPENRLGHVASIVAEHGLVGFFERVRALLASNPPATAPALVAALTPHGSHAGRSWALEAWTNVILPLLSAHGRHIGDKSLVARATEAYAYCPGGGDNSRLHRMVEIAGIAAPPRRAIEQQGLLHLWYTRCSRQNCGECPLAAF
jgi:hypothetical protein